MPGTPLPPNPKLDALEDQRADLAVQISVLCDKGTVDQHTISELRSGGHIEKSHEFEAKDDAAAMMVPEAWREGREIELWQRWD
jgi:hypothetical protein